jgi:sRNA-binding carbon storage regulator CsrA
MPTITREEGQAVQIGDITVTILKVGESEVHLQIDGLDDAPVELRGAEMDLQGRPA